MNPRKQLLTRGRSVPGFTLTELLVVVAIMALLGSFSIPALHGLFESRNLESSGNRVVDLTNQARQNSLSQGVVTAMVLVTGSSNPDWNNRLFTLLQLAPGASAWTPASPWTMLPKGVLVDGSQSASFTQQAATLPQALGTLTYAGTALPPTAYVYQAFMPNGQILINGLANALPPALRLVQGVMNQSTLTYIGNAGSNYYDVTLNLYTGTPTVDRP